MPERYIINPELSQPAEIPQPADIPDLVWIHFRQEIADTKAHAATAIAEAMKRTNRSDTQKSEQSAETMTRNALMRSMNGHE